MLFLIMVAGEWGDAVRMRLKAVGLPRSWWVMLLYGSFVYTACALPFYLSSKGRFLAPGLFVLLNLPLAVMREKPSAQG